MYHSLTLPRPLSNYITITSPSSLRNSIACTTCTCAHSCAGCPTDRVQLRAAVLLYPISYFVLVTLLVPNQFSKMTITLPPPEKDNQPPPPNPLNVLNLLLSKLKAMEQSTESSGEVTDVDIELCNKIFYILNPASAPTEEAPLVEAPAEGEAAPTVEGVEGAPAEGAPPAEGGEAVPPAEGASMDTAAPESTPAAEAPTDAPAEVAAPVEAAA